MASSPLRRNLSLVVWDGVAFSVMVSLGENLFPAFVLALGMSGVASGLITAVPLLVGAVLQLVSPLAIVRLGSYRRWVVICALLQALSFLPLSAGGLLGSMETWALFGAASLYYGAGLATGPAWSTWVGWLVPGILRARYFANRFWYCHLATVVGLLAAGYLLQIGERESALLPSFAGLFLLAAIARLISSLILSRQSEPSPIPKILRHVPPREFLSRLRRHGDGRLLLYLVALQLTACIASPYISPYLLGRLKFEYWPFTALIGAPFLSRMLTFPLWGSLAHRFGARALLWVGAIGVIWLPWLWTLSPRFPVLLVIQLFGGAVWAAYELGSFLLYFDAIAEEDRTSMLTTFNLLHSSATVAGALLGGVYLHRRGETLAAYETLFVLSLPARALPLLLLAWAHKSLPRR